MLVIILFYAWNGSLKPIGLIIDVEALSCNLC